MLYTCICLHIPYYGSILIKQFHTNYFVLTIFYRHSFDSFWYVYQVPIILVNGRINLHMILHVLKNKYKYEIILTDSASVCLTQNRSKRSCCSFSYSYIFSFSGFKIFILLFIFIYYNSWLFTGIWTPQLGWRDLTGMKLLIHSQTSTVAPLKFRNG